jgi:hypothetical protein
VPLVYDLPIPPLVAVPADHELEDLVTRWQVVESIRDDIIPDADTKVPEKLLGQTTGRFDLLYLPIHNLLI